MSTKLLPCPFCGSQDIDPEGWMCSDRRCGPACDDCAGSADTVELWNNRPRETQEWQDISTAPKDGTWVLGYETGINTKYAPHEVMRWGSRFGKDCWFNSSDHAIPHATHWQPLASPPVAVIAEERGTK